MRRAIYLILFFITSVPILAQNEIHKKAVEKFMIQFNNEDFEGIYNSFSPSMQQSRTKPYFFNFFSNVKKRNGALLKLELLEYSENRARTSRGTYDGDFETGLLSVRITVDLRGKITGLYLKRKNLI